MSDMIERVARAICKQEYGSEDAGWENQIPAARAAIEAMRIASGPMLDAASDVVVGFDDFSTDDGTIYLSRTAAGQAYRIMIDAALEAKP